jgi:D-alanyl-D-alanine carboxypeptidase
MKYLFALLALVTSISCTNSQSVSTAGLDRLFSIYDSTEIFFVNGLVRRDGKTLHQYSSGYENVEMKIKNSAKTRFMIGSITKTYTAAIIMQLKEEGKLRLDDKLAKFLPDIPNADQITVEMLLRHRSGLHNYTSEPDFMTEVVNPISKSQFLEKFKNLAVDFTPDSTFQYSNTNYILLGAIIEEVSGDTYANQLQTRIIDKLGMKATTLGRPAGLPNMAKSYQFIEDVWKTTTPKWNSDWAWAAGGISATAEDVALFLEALFGGKLVSSESLELMTDIKEGYGFGLVTIPFNHQRFYGHSGGIETFYSIAGYNPDDRTVIVRLINGNKDFDGNDISIQLLNAAYGHDIKYPDLTIVKVDEEILRSYEGEYSAENFPLAIKIFLEGDKLFGQATGQNAFPLRALSDTEFEFRQAGIKIHFLDKEGRTGFKFQQGTHKFEFLKK